MFTLWTWGMQRSCWQASLLTGYFHTVDMALVLKSCWQASLPTDYFHIVDVVRVQILQVGSPSYCQVTKTLQTLDVLDPFAAAWSLWHRAAKKLPVNHYATAVIFGLVQVSLQEAWVFSQVAEFLVWHISKSGEECIVVRLSGTWLNYHNSFVLKQVFLLFDLVLCVSAQLCAIIMCVVYRFGAMDRNTEKH